MVDADQDNVLLCQIGSVIERKLAAGSHCVTASVKPNHNWTFLSVVYSLSPNIKYLTIIRLCTIIPLIKEGFAVVLPGNSGSLITLVSPIKGGLDAIPIVRVLRCFKAFGLGVLYSLKGIDTILDVT